MTKDDVELVEPSLTCPGIDEAIALTEDAALKEALERVRFENSNMRHSMWAFKAFADDANARATTLRARLDGETEALTAADYLINRLDNVTRGKPVRDLDEAWSHYVTAKGSRTRKDKPNEQ